MKNSIAWKTEFDVTIYTANCFSVSNQILGEDVRNLRVGLEDVKKEKEKEPDNFIIFVSPYTP